MNGFKLGITLISGALIVGCLPLFIDSKALESGQELRTKDVPTPDNGYGAKARLADGWNVWKELGSTIKVKTKKLYNALSEISNEGKNK